jgi:hypothetical protein
MLIALVLHTVLGVVVFKEAGVVSGLFYFLRPFPNLRGF